MKKFVGTLVLALLLDQFTKFLAGRQGWVTTNSGISFGLLEQTGSWFIPLASLIILGVFAWQFLCVGKQYMTASAVFLAGAASNMLDRLRVGAVQDWLPIPGMALHNNLADWYIALSLLYVLGKEVKKQYA